MQQEQIRQPDEYTQEQGLPTKKFYMKQQT
jgi:hypothetical protein